MTKFMLGLGLGVAVGMLIAPASGEETRRQLAEKAEDLAEAPRLKVQEALQKGREKAGEIGQETAENAFDEAVKRVVGEKMVQESRQRPA